MFSQKRFLHFCSRPLYLLINKQWLYWVFPKRPSDSNSRGGKQCEKNVEAILSVVAIDMTLAVGGTQSILCIGSYKVNATLLC